MTSNDVRASLVSANDRLRGTVFQAIQDGGLPVRMDGEIPVPAHALDPEHLERLRNGEPEVVILDMSEDPARAIRACSAVASGNPRAALVGVGPQLDAGHLLEAMRAGLVEYVPQSSDGSQVREALERVLKKRGWAESAGGHRNGEVMAFFSAKGGSGSTSVVTNVGIELHRITGRKTLLVDLDLELGEISSHMGVQPRFHFVDLVRNFHRMDTDLLASYIESHESGVQVLSAPFEPEIGEVVSGEEIARILNFLRQHFDYVLVDTSKSLAPQALAALQTANLIFLVTNMDVPSLRNLKRCLPILDRVTAGDADRLRLVVNRFNPRSLVGLDDLEETLGLEVFATLTNDFQSVIEGISTGRPLVLKGGTRYAEELEDLARAIVEGDAGLEPEKRSLVSRILSPFKSSSSSPRRDLTPTGVEAQAHG